MTHLLVAALLLSATGQRAGVPAGGGDASGRTVVSTGSTTARSLGVRFADVVNVKDYGAAGNFDCTAHTGTNDTAAITAARQAAESTGAKLFFPPGRYGIDATALNWRGHKGIRILGSGVEDTFLCARTPSHGIEVEGVGLSGMDGYTYHIEIAHLSIVGYGRTDPTPDKHGIYFHDNGPYGGPSHIHIHDVNVRGFSGRGVYMVQEWHTTLENVTVNDCGDHLFDLAGGNTTTLVRTYAQTVQSGKAGYRIRGGNVTLISANGVNGGAGSIWGLFGSHTGAGDPVVNYFRGTLIGCNVEDFEATGVQLRDGSHVNIIATIFTAAANAANVKAIDAYATGGRGSIDGASRFILKSGASWANSTPIHTYTGAAPFFVLGAPTSGLDATTFYSASAALSYPLPHVTMATSQSGYANAAIKATRFQANAFISTPVAPTYGTSVTIDHNLGSVFKITPTNGTAFTMSNPVGAPNAGEGQRLTIRIVNTTGGALGTVTWSSKYKMAAWTNPATGFSRSIEFLFDGTNFIEVGRTPDDVPN